MEVLQKMRDAANLKLSSQEPNRRCVVTIPAYFSQEQKNATIAAIKMANLNLISLLEEPVAAALATGLQKYAEANTHILVYDFGGGTLDVTILKVANNQFYVVSTAGNDYLGGQDIDNILIDTVIDQYLSENNEGEERTKVEIK